MMRMSFLSALAVLMLSSAGCCCCGNWGSWWRPAPVATACPPPAPACDPCTTAPVTYGAPAPVMPYVPPAM
jgi:hypothetical protein